MFRYFRKLIPAGSFLLATTTLASYIMGLFRDRIFAQTFGASRLLDSYNAAFLLPDLLFNILVASGIAAAFVPIFTDLAVSDKKRADSYANSVLTAATATMMIVSLIMIVFAKKISFLVAPGFSPEDRLVVANILRILSISPIIFGVSNTIGAMLISKQRFFLYGLSPVLYNAGIIAGTIFLAPRYGINGVAIGTVAGALLHLIIRAIDAMRSGFKFNFNFQFKTSEFKRTIRLMIPKMFGHPVELAMFWGFTVIASSLAPGSVAVMNFARNFMSVPVSLIGVTLSTTAFPILAGAIANRSPEKFRLTLKNSFWLILGGSIFCAVVTFVIKEPLIRIVLGGGQFNHADIARTALVLGAFTLAMPTESLVHLLARAFYATKNTVIPVIMSIIGLVISIGGAYLLIPKLDIVAIPVAFALASLTELIFLMILLPHRIRQLPASPPLTPETEPH